MNEELTPRQRQVYDFIVERMERMGRPPTVREVGSALGIRSTNGVRYFLEVLEERGFIERDPGFARGIRVPASARRHPRLDVVKGGMSRLANAFRPAAADMIPILGAIAAGSPILAEENIEGSVAVDASFPGSSGGAFALRVRGDSMRDAGILDGDLVIVRADGRGDHGAIVVAYWDGEATVKRLHRSRGEIVLHPENAAFEDIRIPAGQEDFRLLGTVTGVIRRVK